MTRMGSPKGERSECPEKQASGQAKGRRAASGEREEEELAREAWLLLFELMRGEMRHLPAIAAEFELSPVQLHVLRSLGEAPLPMSTLAGCLGCDASNVTGLVDRLEGRGLVERQSAPYDRRVKLLALTEAGGALRERLLARLTEPPRSISALSVQELRSLREVLKHALEHVERSSSEPLQARQSSKKV
jgi:DNA-binding MarR family transcriptional regulator